MPTNAFDDATSLFSGGIGSRRFINRGRRLLRGWSVARCVLGCVARSVVCPLLPSRPGRPSRPHRVTCPATGPRRPASRDDAFRGRGIVRSPDGVRSLRRSRFRGLFGFLVGGQETENTWQGRPIAFAGGF